MLSQGGQDRAAFGGAWRGQVGQGGRGVSGSGVFGRGPVRRGGQGKATKVEMG